MDKLSQLTVCVTTYNEEENIEQCINGIKGNGVSNILVIDASSDATADLAKKHGAVVYSVKEDERGRAVQKGLAINLCKTQYLAFVDADDVLDSNCMRILLKEMEENGWDAIQAHGRAYMPKTYWEKGMDALCHYILSRPGPTNMVGRPCVHTISSLKDIDGIDDRFDEHDDTTISIRLEEKGYKQGIGSGVTYRKHPASYKDCRDHWERYGIQDARLVLHYPEKKRNIYRHLLVEYPIIRSLKLICFGKIKYVPYTVLCGLIRYKSMKKTLREERQ